MAPAGRLESTAGGDYLQRVIPPGAPSPTSRAESRATLVFTALVTLAALLVFASLFVILRAPVEKTMGVVQKIFYFHVPSAVSMYVGATACFCGSVAYLMRPTDLRDAIGRAGAELAVLFGVVVLGTGSLWASKAWGTYWTWDPRLTTMLLSVLIYVAYLVLRAFGGEGEGERKFAAALGVIGAANLPIIHFSVQKWAGQHPTVITSKGGGLQHPDMKLALGLGFAAMFAVVASFLWLRVRGQLLESRFARLEEDAFDLGVDEGTAE
jgi:heme exporter protein C